MTLPYLDSKGIEHGFFDCVDANIEYFKRKVLQSRYDFHCLTRNPRRFCLQNNVWARVLHLYISNGGF